MTKVITKKSKKENRKDDAVNDLIESLMGVDRPSKNPSPEEIQNQKKKEAKKV